MCSALVAAPASGGYGFAASQGKADSDCQRWSPGESLEVRRRELAVRRPHVVEEVAVIRRKGLWVERTVHRDRLPTVLPELLPDVTANRAMRPRFECGIEQTRADQRYMPRLGVVAQLLQPQVGDDVPCVAVRLREEVPPAVEWGHRSTRPSKAGDARHSRRRISTRYPIGISLRRLRVMLQSQAYSCCVWSDVANSGRGGPRTRKSAVGVRAWLPQTRGASHAPPVPWHGGAQSYPPASPA